MRISLLLGLGAAALLAGQVARRSADEKHAQLAAGRLASTSARMPGTFDPAMVAGLPEPARRYFLFAIAPGARLAPVVQVRMEGQLSLGSKAQPDYQPMQAEQVLASPHGFVWQVRAGRGAMRMSGSDGMVAGDSWTRFWLLGTVPVARTGGDIDHLRSSFGRAVAEAAGWAPASLLPQEGVEWSAVDADTARVTVKHAGMRQAVDIRVDAAGQPLWVRMQRWSNANPEGVFREQPFGGEFSDFRSVEGYRVPFRMDGGNFFGTPDYFAFCRARVLSWRAM